MITKLKQSKPKTVSFCLPPQISPRRGFPEASESRPRPSPLMRLQQLLLHLLRTPSHCLPCYIASKRSDWRLNRLNHVQRLLLPRAISFSSENLFFLLFIFQLPTLFPRHLHHMYTAYMCTYIHSFCNGIASCSSSSR